MSKQEAINYWKKAAQKDFKTAKDFFAGKHYDWSLFVGHLALEKIIKGLIYKKTKKQPLPIHDLVKLAKFAEIELSQDQINNLKTINRFCLEARYDDYKLKFYKEANKKFTTYWLGIIKQLFPWFKKLY